MEYAAITSIQPTWKEPYRFGIPIVCELTISFTDMSPLFKKTLETGSIINVNQARQKSEYETGVEKFNEGYEGKFGR